eukprot:m.60595 g.60595  ORF g.60595 m.60595 type:complete len:547 (-) comp22859_c1_seq1:100-1740(-)
MQNTDAMDVDQDMVGYKIIIGNTAVPKDTDGGQCTAWTLFIRCGSNSSLIEKIVVKLHPTFKTNVYELTQTDTDASGTFFLPALIGWGTFEVNIGIHWLESTTITHLKYELSFDQPVTSKDYSVEVLVASRNLTPNPIASNSETLATNTTLGDRRTDLTKILKAKRFIRPQDPRFFHGRCFDSETLTSPTVTWKSKARPRDDMGEDLAWLTATEFQDTSDVNAIKIKALARLLRLSKNTVVYSGAGISVAANINMAAKGSSQGEAQTIDWRDTQPTYTHHALKVLTDNGLIHRWVQQNHDGLPQKAGYPQELLNEVHGSWHDPSNPVVKYDGELRNELYESMVEDANTADLVLVLGTSLSGLNADQVATTPAKQSKLGKSLGTVIINLQQTSHDGMATLRMFNKTDTIFADLINELGLQCRTDAKSYASPEHRVLVPYDADGRLLPSLGNSSQQPQRKMWLDLKRGALVRLAKDHNCKGSKQSSYKNLTAGTVGKVIMKSDKWSAFVIEIGGKQLLLGQWWLKSAKKGAVPILPIVNAHPEYEMEN